ncbi:hypothetical protein [Rhizobium mayense]|uniref:Uncharacterized protein n=1 Tax=Rhizobium mayense TaxID=1312184 RepID=A0ABT7K3H4_9HYPH|nr:hypothetical protein [Rhizobium mayense]MDL2401963.1 hypothetical protein [Rhizobium mayense]
MNDLIYAGAIVAGAVTLLIEAFRNFNSQTGDHPFSLHPILKEVEVRSLCTTGEIIAGFTFYAALYLIVYAVVLGSAEVYGLLLSASKARSEIGATDNVLMPASDPSLLSASGYGKPIFVSALLISFLSIGAVKPIEATMRSLAHRMAGIPRGVYRVIESLRGLDYDEFTKDQPGLLVTSFRAATESIRNKADHGRKIAEIESSLATIDYLSVATSANNRMLYFPLYQMSELESLSNKLDGQLAGLHVIIADLQKKLQSKGEDGETQPDLHETWDALSKLQREAAIVRSNTMAVFAVLFVRNNRSVFSQSGLLRRGAPKSGRKTSRKEDTKPPSPMEKTVKRIQEKYNAEQNSFAISMVVGLVVGAIVTFLVYDQWRDWKVESDKSVYSEQARLLENEINEQIKANNDAANTKDKAEPVCSPTVNNYDECKTNEAKRRYNLSQRPIFVEATAWDTLHSGLLVFLSVFFVLVAREVRIEQQSWRTDWKFYQFPFLTLLGMSFLSGLIAIFASAAVNFAKLAWAVNFHLTQTQIIFLFEQSGEFFALHFGAGLILSFAALVIMDKHRHLSVFWTVLISIIFSALYAAYMWLAIFLTYGSALPAAPKAALISQQLRDTFIFCLVPFLFLLTFAVMLEITEAGDDDVK